jgi:hypothetical protein
LLLEFVALLSLCFEDSQLLCIGSKSSGWADLAER